MNLNWTKSPTYTRLAGPGHFSWRLFWWSYLILFIPQILFDVIAFESPSLDWLWIWTSSHLAAAALVIAAKLLGFDRFQAKHLSTLANLALASAAGIIRVVWVGVYSFEAGLITEFDLPTRTVSGIILGLILFISLANLLEISNKFSMAQKVLLRTQGQLYHLGRLAKKEASKAHQQITEQTRLIVEPRLREIARLLKASSLSSKARESIISNLSDILENQVTPLNKSLRAVSRSLDSPALLKGVSRWSLFKVPPAVKADLAISPFWMFVLLLGVVPFSLYVFEGTQWAILGLAISLLSYLFIWIAREILSRQPLVPLTTAISQYLLLIIQLSILHFALLLFAGFPERSAPYVVLMIFITLTFTTMAVGVEALQERNRNSYLAQINRNNLRIERELGLLNQRVWVEKRRWALTMHGTVQASLTAALARLKQGGTITSSELRKISQHVLQAKRGLSGPEKDSFDFKKALKQTQKTWEGIMNVQIMDKGPAYEALAKSQWAAFCANEIVKEALSNAFKHGSATNVGVSFTSETKGTVTILVANDGKQPSKAIISGLGNQLLNEIAYPWSLTRGADGLTLLKAQLPVSKAGKKS